jgi:hypothetical protein
LTESQPELRNRLAATLQQWRDRQLAYYHYPQYYRRYFPPAPPHPSHLRLSAQTAPPPLHQTRSATVSQSN